MTHHSQGAQQTRNLITFEDFIEILSLSNFTQSVSAGDCHVHRLRISVVSKIFIIINILYHFNNQIDLAII